MIFFHPKTLKNILENHQIMAIENYRVK